MINILEHWIDEKEIVGISPLYTEGKNNALPIVRYRFDLYIKGYIIIIATDYYDQFQLDNQNKKELMERFERTYDKLVAAIINSQLSNFYEPLISPTPDKEKTL